MCRLAAAALEGAAPGRGGGGPSSFIRRCWFQDRGCGESSDCSDTRALFEGRTEVDRLPPPGECAKPKYIVTGSRLREGVMNGNRLASLTFPGEKWYKCCMTKDKKPRFQCQEVGIVPFHTLVQDDHGWCGSHFCLGTRDRCLIVNKALEDVKTQRKRVCPKACPTHCEKERERRECVHIGEEPEAGDEGAGMESPFGRFGEPAEYEVYSLGAPAPAALFVPWASSRPSRAAAARRWASFLC